MKWMKSLSKDLPVLLCAVPILFTKVVFFFDLRLFRSACQVVWSSSVTLSMHIDEYVIFPLSISLDQHFQLKWTTKSKENVLILFLFYLVTSALPSNHLAHIHELGCLLSIFVLFLVCHHHLYLLLSLYFLFTSFSHPDLPLLVLSLPSHFCLRSHDHSAVRQSVISPCVFMKYVCLSKYGFISVCWAVLLAVCTEWVTVICYISCTVACAIPNFR